MTRLYKNAASTTLTTGLTATSGSMAMAVADTSAFPYTAAPDNFFLWLSNGGAAFEIVLATGNSAQPGPGVMTVLRGEDETMPQVWPIGTLVERVVVAKEYGEFVSASDALVALQGNLTVAGAVEFTGGITLGDGLLVPSGGTGRNTLTDNAILVGQVTDPIAFLVPDVAGNLLQAEGGAWVQKTPNQVVTKAVVDNALNAVPLGVSKGGTGAATLATGELVVANGTGAFTTTPITTVNPLSTTKFLRKKTTYSTAGEFEYTPADGSYVVAYIYGAGGGGNRGDDYIYAIDDFNNATAYSPGGAGGAGGFSYWSFVAADSVTLTLVVGAGGASSGGAGGLSGVYGNAISKEATGGGGGGAASGDTNGTPGANGTGSKTLSNLPTNGLTVPPVTRVSGELAATTAGGSGGGAGGGSPSGYGAAGTAGRVVIEEYY